MREVDFIVALRTRIHEIRCGQAAVIATTVCVDVGRFTTQARGEPEVVLHQKGVVVPIPVLIDETGIFARTRGALALGVRLTLVFVGVFLVFLLRIGIRVGVGTCVALAGITTVLTASEVETTTTGRDGFLVKTPEVGRATPQILVQARDQTVFHGQDRAIKEPQHEVGLPVLDRQGPPTRNHVDG